MIFVDTSVWISFFRGKDPRLVNHLGDLLEQDRVALAGPVWIELLTGASRSDLSRLRRVFSALPRFFPGATTWLTVEKWIEKAAISGHRFAAMDLLIGAIAAEHEGQTWSLDRDFSRMSALKFLKIYLPESG